MSAFRTLIHSHSKSVRNPSELMMLDNSHISEYVRKRIWCSKSDKFNYKIKNWYFRFADKKSLKEKIFLKRFLL